MTYVGSQMYESQARAVGSVKPMEPPGIARDLTAMIEVESRLKDCLSRLRVRLEPLCLPSSPSKETGGGVGAGPVRSAFGSALQQHVYAIEEAASWIDDILARLEV